MEYGLIGKWLSMLFGKKIVSSLIGIIGGALPIMYIAIEAVPSDDLTLKSIFGIVIGSLISTSIAAGGRVHGEK
jgi:hypothetical protein